MEPILTGTTEVSGEHYKLAAHQLIALKKTETEVIDYLISEGVNSENAFRIVSQLQGEITEIKKARARKDMLYGALWCVGGIALTVADVGYIFWGAIVFGGIQFFRGLANNV